MDVFVKDGEEYAPLSEDYTVLSKSEFSSNYVTKQEQNDAIQAAVNSRFKNHLHKDSAHEDETVVARVLESHGGKEKNVDLDAQREQWAKANLEPVRQQLEGTNETLQKLTNRLKYAEMREEFGRVFDDTFIERLDPTKPSLAEVMVGDQIDFDVDTSSVRVKNSTMSLADFAKELAADDKYKRFLREPERNTTRASIGQDGGGATLNGQKPTKRSDIADPAEYMQKYGVRKSKVEGWPAYMDLK